MYLIHFYVDLLSFSALTSSVRLTRYADILPVLVFLPQRQYPDLFPLVTFLHSFLQFCLNSILIWAYIRNLLVLVTFFLPLILIQVIHELFSIASCALFLFPVEQIVENLVQFHNRGVISIVWLSDYFSRLLWLLGWNCHLWQLAKLSNLTCIVERAQSTNFQRWHTSIFSVDFLTVFQVLFKHLVLSQLLVRLFLEMSTFKD